MNEKTLSQVDKGNVKAIMSGLFLTVGTSKVASEREAWEEKWDSIV